MKFLVVLLAISFFQLSFGTKDPVFGEPKWLTKEELSKFNGKDDSPIYLSIKGRIFDVTVGRKYYGGGTGYGFFAGKDASRSFVDGCFQDSCPDPSNLEGLSEEELKGVDEWLEFYQDHKDYKFVGYLVGNVYSPKRENTEL